MIIVPNYARQTTLIMLELSLQGSVVKRLRHRPFTAVTRVRFPSESFGSNLLFEVHQADVAQLAEQLICNQQVIGSSPIVGFWTFSSVG